MLLAMKWIHEEEKNWKPRDPLFLICTDRRSPTDALEHNDWRVDDHWIKETWRVVSAITSRVAVLWIPSHVDIPGNERADELAGEGSLMSQEGVPVTFGVMKARIKQRKWTITYPEAISTCKCKRHIVHSNVNVT